MSSKSKDNLINRIARSLELVPTKMPSTGRLPRYRIQIPKNAKDLLVGTTLADKYYVLSVLGKGGMSVVYKAKVLQTGQIVAIKTLRMQGLNDELTVKRFQREAEVLRLLDHPHIVRVFDYQTTKRGQPYFVMDYLTGVDLHRVIKREKNLSPERMKDIFMQVCGAVGHAHKNGFVHRDLKPGNIMLVPQDGQKDYVKVVDFGIAKLKEEVQRLTRMGEVWGSPVYMSPEQCMGSNLDARSDVYSLGIVMYEALTGEVPFLGINYVDTMTKQISEQPPPFSQVRPDLSIPARLEEIVMKALEKNPDNRYQSTIHIRRDLEAAMRPSTAELSKPKNRAPVQSGKHKTVSRNKLPAATPPAAPRKGTRDDLSSPQKKRKRKVKMRSVLQLVSLLALLCLVSGISFAIGSNENAMAFIKAELTKLLDEEGSSEGTNGTVKDTNRKGGINLDEDPKPSPATKKPTR